MATIHFASNTYAGEVLEDLLLYTAHGNDTYEEGLIYVKPGVQKRLVLPHIELGDIVQDNVATPKSPGTPGAEGAADDATGFNQYKHSERYLDPQDLMIYVEFNPRDYEEYWRPFQPEGPLNFRELAPEVQAKMLHLLIDKKDQYINDAIWGSRLGGEDATKVSGPAEGTVLGGRTAGGKMKYFHGAVMRVLNNIAADASVGEKASGQVVLAGDTELTTGEQVEKALYAMWMKCPKHVRKSKKLKFVMGWDLWDLYDQYLTSKDVKYTENTDQNRRRFKGKQIVVIDGMPESTIFLGRFSKERESCLWMAVDYATDQESVKVAPLQANSELWFFQMRMKIDVNIVLPSEIVCWTAYKNV